MIKAEFDWNLHALDWPAEQVAEWRRAYVADEPVVLPFAEHPPGECRHCDRIRELMREVDAA